MVLTARGPEQQPRAPTPCGAWINLALALGLPGRPRSAATAASPGRATARAGASTGRRPTSCPATAARRPGGARARRRGVGRRPGRRCPARASAPTSCSTRCGTRRSGRCSCMGSNPVVSAPRRRARRGAARGRSTSSSSCDFVLSRDRARSPTSCCRSTQWAEETGTMTNLEGRVLLRRAGGHRPAGVRSDLEILAGWPTGSASRRASRPTPRRSSTSCARASAGGAGRLLRHHLRADRRGGRGLLAVPGRTDGRRRPARRGCSPTASPPRTAGPGSSPVDAPAGRPRSPTTDYPLLPHHRPGARALPVRRADPAGAPR